MNDIKKKQMIILIGPPCSGKSTWVKDFLNGVDNISNWSVINRDSYRYMIGNGKYTMNHEDEVTKMENDETQLAIDEGNNLIIDNTNLNPKYRKVWYDIAEKNGYEVIEKEFYVPYKEALKRSKQRRDNGGLYITRDVMRNFYRKYYKDKFEEEMTDSRIKYVNKQLNESLPSCVIFDLDGTIALHNKREPFEWNKIPTDVLDSNLYIILYGLQMIGVEIIFLTGRPEIQGDIDIRKLTEEWLDKNDINEYQLLMREASDRRSGEIVKKEQYEKYIKGKYNVIAIFDDSNKCVDMWRNENLLCLQPENGDY